MDEKIRKVGTITCPQCKGSMEVTTREDHTFWPEGILQVMMHCSSCGHRFVDVFPLVEQPPNKQELFVNKTSLLTARVVKSSRAKVSIPELGVEIDPGPSSEGYITNVEGILDRIEMVLKDMVRWKKPGAREMLRRVKAIRKELREPFTLIIEDMSGSSIIISDETKRSKL
jgi:zinc finger protein